MALPRPSRSLTLRLRVPSGSGVADAVAALAGAGGAIHRVEAGEPDDGSQVVEIEVDTSGDDNAVAVQEAVAGLEGVEVLEAADDTFVLHEGGKIEVGLTSPLATLRDLSRAYTPGVARVCRAIADDVSLASRYTIKGNTVAVVTDGTAVLGLGDIGPEAALPVMEGKAALFKTFAGVDAWPVCLDTTDTEEIIRAVKALAPVYGGINLEDISAPRCFEIEERLRAELPIPVFHDDQHGTAVVCLAALLNAVRVAGKELTDLRVVVSGVGAAGTAIIKLLQAAGVRDIVGYGRDGALGPGQTHASRHRQWLADHTNPRGLTGSLEDGLVGADVFIGVSRGGILTGEHIASMNEGAIVFAMSNPMPEVDPGEAAKHAAVVATGRSDYPNQINNVLVFPGLFRGLLDAGARDVTTPMLLAAARAVAGVITDDELNAHYVIPGAFDSRVAPLVAAAVAEAAGTSPSASDAAPAGMSAGK